MFPLAGAADIIRCVQKDEYLTNSLRDQIKELSVFLFGHGASLWENEIDLLSNCCYFGLTTLLGRQSLGEEYCDIMQMRSERRPGKYHRLTLPAPSRRAILYTLHLILPYVYQRIKHRAQAGLNPDIPQSGPWLSKFFSRCWHRFLQLCYRADAPLSYFQRFHLALFYLFGSYFEISKRAVGVRYVLVRQSQGPQFNYQILGILIIIQLLITAYQAAREINGRDVEIDFQGMEDEEEEESKDEKELAEVSEAASWWDRPLSENHHRQRQSGRSDEKRAPAASISIEADDQKLSAQLQDEDDEDSEKNKCILCFSRREKTTATECGHLFCWNCITRALNTKPECPLCRGACNLCNLIRVNMD